MLRRMGSASKAEISRAANLTNAAVGSIVGSLEELDLILSGKKRKKGQRGQPATLMHLNPTGAYGIGVRIERNSIQTVLIDFDGHILSKLTHEMLLPKPEEALDLIADDIRSLLSTMTQDAVSRLTGIGLARPFHLGSWLKELGLPASSFTMWDHYDFASRLEEVTRIPVQEENDGTAAAIAELFYGAGRQIDDFLYLFFGPAIGGGLVMKGDIVRGPTGNAADVAMIPVSPSTLSSAPPPSLRDSDILINRASLNSLRRHLKLCYPEEGFDTRLNLEQAVRNKPDVIDEWIDDCLDAIIPVILTGKAFIDFETVVLSANINGRLTETLREQIEKRLPLSLPETGIAPTIISGSFGCDAGAVGAASIPIFYNFSPRKPIS